MNEFEKDMLKAALLGMTIATPTSSYATNSPTTLNQNTPTTTVTNNGELKRSDKINEVTPDGRKTARYIYNWQEVAAKYDGYIDLEAFSKGKKLSSDEKFEYAAVLRAIIRNEAKSPSAIDDKYYYDSRLGKISDAQCEENIKSAGGLKDQSSFSQMIQQEKDLMQKNKKVRDEALSDFNKFRELSDQDKGTILTDKVDDKIEQNVKNSRTLSAAAFLKLRSNSAST